jgi:hypothetical protein
MIDVKPVTLTVLLACFAISAVTFSSPTSANAQGRPLLVIPFEREQISDEDFNRFLSQIRADADESSEYSVLPPVDQALSDLLFAVGCAEPDPECLQLIGESFGAEVILYGSVWRNDRTLLQTVNLFDVLTGASVLDNPIEETFENDNPEELFDIMVATIQQIFFPYTGELTVNTTDPGAEIFFDGEPVGNTASGPLSLTGRPLGHHIITARQGELEAAKPVVLVHGRAGNVEINVAEAAQAGGGSDYGHLFSYVAFGVGGASLIGGVVFSFMTSSADKRAAELGDVKANPRLTSADTDEADGLRNSGPTYQLLQYLFYGVGTAAIITGGVLYYYEGSDSESPSESAGRTIIAPFISGDAVGAGALITF